MKNDQRQEQRKFLWAGGALCCLSALLLLFTILPLPWAQTRQDRYEASGRKAARVPLTSPQGSVNINLADAEELAQLAGIGETLAQCIIDERETNGAFFYPEDLLCVRGIGKKKLEALRPFVCFESGMAAQ